TRSFSPRVAILLNINKAHLDRHRSLAEYARVKSRIFMNHRPNDILILNFDDARVRPLARKHQGRTFFVSQQQVLDRGAWLQDGVARVNINGTVEELGEAAPPLVENFLAAVVAARACGIEPEQLARALTLLESPSNRRAWPIERHSPNEA
ncbi:MAG: UDP-N-acetylmuramoyl-L-alanine--D-glutamate ligase, partial [Planctomycetes bacterium]|nr:UDP-N-acetylmuramoyl-L-alanine--D-glutamate ligase [Planctomycetota bacterium]